MAKKTVDELNPEIIKLAKNYLAVVEASGIPVEQALIFGSQAKGTARPDSDIDLAIISPIFGKDTFEERLRLMRLRQKNYEIEPHPLHPNDLNDKWSTFASEIRKYGISIK